MKREIENVLVTRKCLNERRGSCVFRVIKSGRQPKKFENPTLSHIIAEHIMQRLTEKKEMNSLLETPSENVDVDHISLHNFGTNLARAKLTTQNANTQGKVKRSSGSAGVTKLGCAQRQTHIRKMGLK